MTNEGSNIHRIEGDENGSNSKSDASMEIRTAERRLGDAEAFMDTRNSSMKTIFVARLSISYLGDTGSGLRVIEIS